MKEVDIIVIGAGPVGLFTSFFEWILIVPLAGSNPK